MAETYKKEMPNFVEKLGGDRYLNHELCELILNL